VSKYNDPATSVKTYSKQKVSRIASCRLAMEDKSCELIDVTVPKLVLHSRSIRFRFGPLVVAVEVDEVLLECRVGVASDTKQAG
jgi:hypothetical protein